MKTFINRKREKYMGETSEIPSKYILEVGELIIIVGIAAEILQTLTNDTATSQM